MAESLATTDYVDAVVAAAIVAALANLTFTDQTNGHTYQLVVNNGILGLHQIS